MKTYQTYISILRGINVSGKRIIKMDALRELYSSLDFEDVKTYIQSGNVIFRAAKLSRELIATKIRQAVMDKFSFDVRVIVLAPDDLSTILKLNPLLEQYGHESEKLHITILENTPEPNELDSINNIVFADDIFVCVDRAVYLYCTRGYGNTKFNNNFFEKKLKVAATTRKLKTLCELVNLAKSD